MSVINSYVEHAALRVRDIAWHVRFFRDALGMTVRETDGSDDNPKQIWTIGGVQLIADPEFAGSEGRLAHLGIMTDDLEAALQRASVYDVRALPQGRNWLKLPDGLCLELLQASSGTVAQALAVNPRSER